MTTSPARRASPFRSIAHSHNYRLWAAGAIVSNVGTWMQRTAQDWLVLTQLTHNNATAVGVVMALQFGPQVLMLPLSGPIADRFNRRRVLIFTQTGMGILALALGVMTLAHVITLWEVYGFALLLGCVSALDAPARQTFVSELVSDEDFSNAVALNSTSFNAARLIGPALAGVLIASFGSGWMFVLNAISFGAVLISLSALRTSELRPALRAGVRESNIIDGFRYVLKRPDLRVIFVMLFLIGTFGINYAVFISTMAVRVFHAGADAFGLLTSLMAIGSVAGAFRAAGRVRPSIPLLVGAAGTFGVAFAIAAVMPNYWLFGLALIVVGASGQTFTTSSNTAIQLESDPTMRGRVVSLFLAVAMGSTPIGAPFVGWVADAFGPRWSLAVAAASGIAALAVGLSYLARRRAQSRDLA